MKDKTDAELIEEAQAIFGNPRCLVIHKKEKGIWMLELPGRSAEYALTYVPQLAMELASRLKAANEKLAAARESLEVWKDEALKRETNCDCGYKD